MRAVWISFLEYRSILKNKSESQFKSSVKKYFDNPQNIIVTTLMDENQSSDAHALRFNSYDDKNVYLTDPYDTAAGPIAMSKEEFYKRLIAVDVSDLSSPLED